MDEKRFQKQLAKTQRRYEQYRQLKEIEDRYAECIPDRKHYKFSSIMIVVIVINIVAYVIASFILQYHTGIEMSPTITTCWFSFWTVEIVALTGIKISKTKNHDDS